jgi:hypothetical protein
VAAVKVVVPRMRVTKRAVQARLRYLLPLARPLRSSSTS